MLVDTAARRAAHGRSTSPPDHDRRGRVVIVGYDGSRHARHAVDAAGKRAGPRGTVVAVHVLPPAPAHLGTPYYERAVEERHRRGLQLLRRLRRERMSGPRLETELIHGTPAEALARLARSRNANEIVIGSRGLGRWRALFGRSVSHEVLRLADRPVLVVPPGATGAGGRRAR